MSSSFFQPSVTPMHGVVDEAAREAVKLVELARLAVFLRDQLAVFDDGVDARRQRLTHLTLRALDVDGVAVDLDGDPLRDRDRFLSNSRHISPTGTVSPHAPCSVTRRYRESRRRRRPSAPRGRSSRRATSSGC